jgi:hypothetical protein
VVNEEVAQLWNSNAKLSQDLDGKSVDPLFFLSGSAFVLCRGLIRRWWFAGACLIRVGMVAKLAVAKQERNAAILKVIEKESGVRRFSEQLQSECRTLALSSSSLQAHHDFLSFLVLQRSRPS